MLKAQGKRYQAKYLGSVKAFIGVRDVFEVLTKGGARIALATDCKGPELKHYRSLLNVDDLIDSMRAETTSNTASRIHALSDWRSESWGSQPRRPLWRRNSV